MENKLGHEGSQPSQPSSPTSHDSDKQYCREREEPDSNQSNHRRIDDTSAAVYENNTSRLIEQLFLQQIDRQMEEAALHDTDDSINDDDNVTEEEESLVSDERSNSNSQDDRNQQGTSVLAVLLPTEDGVGRRQYDINRLISLNRNVGSLNRNVGLTLDVDGMSYEDLTELGERIGIVKRGLPKEFISSHLKTRVHTTSGDSAGEEETEICTVCQYGYENNDKIATLGCKHEYHQDCITQWLLHKNVCPVCKGQAVETMKESEKEEEVNEC